MVVESIFIGIFVISLLAEYMDATIGWIRYNADTVASLNRILTSSIVPSILLSQFLCGIFAAILHHGAGNVSFDFKNDTSTNLSRDLENWLFPKIYGIKSCNDTDNVKCCRVFIAVLIALALPVYYLSCISVSL